MRKYLSYSVILSALLLLVLSACEVPFDAELDTAEPTVVIEAVVNDVDTPAAKVRVSRTAPYLEPDTYRPIIDAVVVIEDNLGNVETLMQDSADAGLYTSAAVVGEVGRTYHLTVEADGQTFTSSAAMRANYDMDSVWVVKDDAFFGGDSVWQIWGAGQEPPGKGDFGLFQLYENGEIMTELDNWFVQADDVLDANYIIFPAFTQDVGEAEGNTYTMEVASLDKATYDYLSQVRDLMNGIGGAFSPIPTNPTNNINGGALGQFRVSSVTRISTTVPEE